MRKRSTIMNDIHYDKQSKILPFCESPILSTYNNIGFATGIIQGNNEDKFEPWAYGKYINCMFGETFFLKYVVSSRDIWEEHKDCVKQIDDLLLPPTEFSLHMRKRLCEGYYIMACINEQYIPGMSAYNKYRFIHDSLIIGFDDYKKVFIAYGRLAKQKLSLYEIRYEDFIKLLSDDESWTWTIKYVPIEKKSIDLQKIKSELVHYLMSDTQYERIRETKYGVDAINRLSQYISDSLYEDNYIDYRYTRQLFEQKEMMTHMCNYINNKCYKLSDDILQLSSEVKKISENIHMIAIKHSVNSKYKSFDKDLLMKQFDKIIAYENEYIPELIKQLDVQ